MTTLSLSDLGQEINKIKRVKEESCKLQHQPYHILIELRIQDLHFRLKTLIDTGSDLNLLNKNVIPVSLWDKTKLTVTGLGNILNDISFFIPKATLCFQKFCLDMKFYLAEIPVACVLGTHFLAAVSPHGSTQISSEQQGYFISSPEGKVIKLPFISTPHCTDFVEINLLKGKRIFELKSLQGILRIDEQLNRPNI